MIGLLLLLILVSSLSAQTPQQYSLSGLVQDAESGHPLANANVFLASTMKGGVTDSTGRFVINNVPAGTFELVVSRVGYEVAKREIDVSGELVLTPAFKLRPIVLSSGEVEVTAPYPKKWKSHLERFTDLLLSTTTNSAKTKILNPQILEFREQGDDFLATAGEPLLIENAALGYKISLILEEFIASSEKLQYRGSMQFAELTPSFGKEAEQWLKNRLRAYQGSLRHFLATVSDTTSSFNIRLQREGFEIFKFKFPWERETQRAAETVAADQFLSRDKKSGALYLDFHEYLGVRYIHEREERSFLRYHDLSREAQVQESWIALERGAVKLDPQGRYFNDLAITKFGYWAWERVPDMLPYEYEPD
jgi:hypothetical protein